MRNRRVPESSDGARVWPWVMAMPSGKGGVGKTNVVVNLAVSLSRLGQRVLVMDADLSLANVDLLYGINPRYNLQHVLLGERSLEEVMVQGPAGVFVVPASSGVSELADLDHDRRQKFIRSFRRIEREIDIVLVDIAPGLSSDVVSFSLAADEVLVLTTPEVTAITDAYALIKVMAMRGGYSSFKLVTNMVEDGGEAQEMVERVVLAARRFLGVEVESWGFIYRDDVVPLAVAEQRPFVLAYPSSSAARCVNRLADRIVGLEREPHEDLSLFERMTVKLGHKKRKG